MNPAEASSRRFETRPADWVSFEEARRRVVGACAPRGSQGDLPRGATPLLDAFGRALAEEVRAPLTLPPGPTSHMDGYAVRGSDLAGARAEGVLLPVSGSSLPGAPWTGPLPSGSAVRIMTGGLLPTGADRVIPVEDTDGEATPGKVRIAEGSAGGAPSSAPGRHVRPAGEETKAGQILASPGETVEAGLLALLAAAGIESLRVHPRPRVALVVTGSELVPAGRLDALDGGVRRADVLSPTLPCWIECAGGEALDPRVVADDPAEIRAALIAAAAEADLVVTTGGASMGSADLVKDVLDDLGLALDFWRIRMRPGSPVSFGRIPRPEGGSAPGGTVPVLGLPGNPVSAAVSFLVLAIPAIRALGGHGRTSLFSVSATARGEMEGPNDLARFIRVTLTPEGDGRWGAAPTGAQGSGVIRSLALADGLAYIPAGRSPPGVGAPVEVFLVPRAGWPHGP